jgi:hypothetical protein
MWFWEDVSTQKGASRDRVNLLSAVVLGSSLGGILGDFLDDNMKGAFNSEELKE